MTGRLLILSMLLAAAVSAQIGRSPLQTASRIRIRVTLPDHAPCTASTRVSLIGNMGFSIAETSASGECIATFFEVPAGRYRVSLSGDVANTDTGEIDTNGLQDVEVRARRITDSANTFPGSPTFVSASNLHVPPPAAKEFGKANKMIALEEWSKAADRLHRAVTLYSSFAAAYNNLGAVYSHLGDAAEARSALQRAIVLDDHVPAAYVNLARLDFAEKNFTEAESLLNKESGLAPPNADELNLLAYAEMMNQHLNQAIETSHHAHAIQLPHHAFLHLIAAHVYEEESKIADLVGELQTYLKEEPAAAQTNEVRRALAILQAKDATTHNSCRSC